MKVKTLMKVILAGTTLALFGCGGGGGGAAAPPAGSTIINGVAVKGPVNGADVTVYAIKNGAVDRSVPLGTGKSGGDGSYSITLVTGPTGPVAVEVTGNAASTYADEVSTAAPVPFKTGATLRAVVSTVAAGAASTVEVTPLTEMAFQKASGVSGALTATNIDDANQKVATLFGVGNIIISRPSADAGGTADQKKYAAALGAISQLVTDQKGAAKLEDALVTVLTSLGTEMKSTGELSAATFAALSTAAAKYGATSGNVPALVKPIAGTLRLSTTGTLAAGTLIGGIDVTVELPAGVTVKTLSAAGELDPGAVTISGEAAKAGGQTISGAKFTAAAGATPANVKFIIGTVNPGTGTASGFEVGEFVAIKCDITTTATFPTNAGFKIAAIKVVDGTDALNTLTNVGAAAFSAILQ